MSEAVTQATFARLQGWNKSTVTRLKQAGRLVMQGGLVEVAASVRRIAETGGMRLDVAERHAAERAESQNSPVAPISEAREGEGMGAAPIAPPAADFAGSGGERRLDAQARKEAALADKAEMEVLQMRGDLIPKEDVDAALRAFATSMRARLDVMPDQIAPIVAPVTDLDEVHALLAEQVRDILAAVADEMGRAAKAVGRP